MGGIVGGVTDAVGITNYGEQNDKAKKQAAEDLDKVNQEKSKLELQQKANRFFFAFNSCCSAFF